jgi:site-specific recombinase XerD
MAVLAGNFFDYVPEFTKYRRDIHGVSEQTIKSNLVDLTLFENFITATGHKTITGPSVMDFQYHLKTERNNCGGSINRKIFTLRSYGQFLRLFDVDGSGKLPFYDVLKIRQGYRNQPYALTIKQIKTFFETIDRNTCLGIRDYAVYTLMYQTGLRVGEVHQLDLLDIDFKARQLSVTGKGSKQRILYLTNECRQILSEWLTVRHHFFKSEQHSALFVSKKGNRLAIRTMEDNLKKIVERSGMEAAFNITCHTLRHSFASHLNDKDVDILVIQSLLGHATTRSTEPYIHPSLEKIRKAMEKLPSAIYMETLIETGILDLKFQSKYRKLE